MIRQMKRTGLALLLALSAFPLAAQEQLALRVNLLHWATNSIYADNVFTHTDKSIIHTIKLLGTTVLAIFAVTMLGGCVKDERHNTPHPDKGAVRITTDWSGLSEGAVQPESYLLQIASGQVVGVFITDESSVSIGTNLQYNTDGSAGLTLASATTPTTPYGFTVQTDQSASSSNYYNSDLLYPESATYARSKDLRSLTFKHKLSKVVCTLTVGDGVFSVSGATVKIVGAETKGTGLTVTSSIDEWTGVGEAAKGGYAEM